MLSYKNSDFPDRCSTVVISHDSVFGALRKRLAHEVSSSAVLSELLEKINLMHATHSAPEQFQNHFDEFVSRSAEYSTVIRPFFPELVGFLPSHRGAGEAGECHCPQPANRPGRATRIA